MICEECGGYYELQPGEFPEDYEQCQCGRKLEYSASIPSSKESGDLNTDNSNIVKDNNRLRYFKNKKFLIICHFSFNYYYTIFIFIIFQIKVRTPINYTLLGSFNASNLGLSRYNYYLYLMEPDLLKSNTI